MPHFLHQFVSIARGLYFQDMERGDGICTCCGATCEEDVNFPRRSSVGFDGRYPFKGIVVGGQMTPRNPSDVSEVTDTIDLGDGDILYIRCALDGGDPQIKEEDSSDEGEDDEEWEE